MSRLRAVCVITDTCVMAAMVEGRGRSLNCIRLANLDVETPNTLLVEHDTDVLADSIVDALHSIDHTGESVTLILPLQWCFTHVLAAITGKVTTKRLAFALEDALPVPLEEVTCAFAPLADERFLAAAVPTGPMRALLDGLAKRNILVGGITVDALALALSDDAKDGVAIVDHRWTRVAVGLQNKEQSYIASFAVDSAEETVGSFISGRLEKHGYDEGIERMRMYDLQRTSMALPVKNESGEYARTPDKAFEAIALAALQADELDLCTGALTVNGVSGRSASVKTLARQCLLCAIALSLVITGGMFAKASAIKHRLNTNDEGKQAIYSQVFGTDKIPVGAAARVASKRVQLEGLTQSGRIKNNSQELSDMPALDALRDVVAALPEDVRVKLLNTRIEARQLTLRGQTARHRDAERIAEAVGSVSGLTSRPPRTSRLESGGVEFSIVASRGVSHE